MSQGRLTKKQRQRLKKIEEDALKRLRRRGEVRAAQAETARQQFLREQAEREARRIADRMAEHNIREGLEWRLADATAGNAAYLCRVLRKAGIAHLRPQDEIEVCEPSGRRRTVKVPLVARAVLIGAESREHFKRLAQVFPWLAERQPQSDFGHRPNGTEFPWMIERYYKRQTGEDGRGNPTFVPATVPEREVKEFADSLIGCGPLIAPDDSIKIGEKVVVDDGPFATFPGVVEDIDPDTSHLKVAVSIFGRSTPVVLEPRQVSRA